jgi:hypothetical protein
VIVGLLMVAAALYDMFPYVLSPFARSCSQLSRKTIFASKFAARDTQGQLAPLQQHHSSNASFAGWRNLSHQETKVNKTDDLEGTAPGYRRAGKSI